MREFTLDQVKNIIKNNVDICGFDFDNQNQIIIYSGIYQWQDGTYHDEPEKDVEDDDLIVCDNCEQDCNKSTAHLWRGVFIGDECCWKDRISDE
jgi:hypothetical protein